jgi:hypothetical protein
VCAAGGGSCGGGVAGGGCCCCCCLGAADAAAPAPPAPPGADALTCSTAVASAAPLALSAAAFAAFVAAPPAAASAAALSPPASGAAAALAPPPAGFLSRCFFSIARACLRGHSTHAQTAPTSVTCVASPHTHRNTRAAAAPRPADALVLEDDVSHFRGRERERGAGRQAFAHARHGGRDGRGDGVAGGACERDKPRAAALRVGQRLPEGRADGEAGGGVTVSANKNETRNTWRQRSITFVCVLCVGSGEWMRARGARCARGHALWRGAAGAVALRKCLRASQLRKHAAATHAAAATRPAAAPRAEPEAAAAAAAARQLAASAAVLSAAAGRQPCRRRRPPPACAAPCRRSRRSAAAAPRTDSPALQQPAGGAAGSRWPEEGCWGARK